MIANSDSAFHRRLILSYSEKMTWRLNIVCPSRHLIVLFIYQLLQPSRINKRDVLNKMLVHPNEPLSLFLRNVQLREEYLSNHCLKRPTCIDRRSPLMTYALNNDSIFRLVCDYLHKYLNIIFFMHATLLIYLHCSLFCIT